MEIRSKAAVCATIATCVASLLMLIPPVGVPIFLLVFMLPLWVLDGLVPLDLGHEVNGFFAPNVAGWCVAALATWLVLFVFFYGRARSKARP